MRATLIGCSIVVAMFTFATPAAIAADEEGFTIRGSYSIVPTEPLEIGTRRQLLMDDYVVEDRRALRRVVHPPRKHAANPLLSTGPKGLCPDRSFNYTSVIRDPKTGLYRVWMASSIQVKQPTPPGFYWLTRGRYYESDDGMKWRAPELGLVEVDGTKANNVFLGSEAISYDSAGVSVTPPKWRQHGRYMLVYHLAPAGRDPHPQLIAGGQQLRLAFSDDGVHWRDQKENPIFRGQSDTANNVCYNPDRDVLMYFRRPPIHAGEIRRIAYSESKDLVSWSQPQHAIVPDELDPYSLYCMPVVRYQGVYFGFLHMFYLRPPLRREGVTEKKLKLDVQLAWSRDGKRWERHPQRPLFIETGPPDSYDRGMIHAAKGIIERDGRIEIYYTGSENLHISTMPGESHLCLATLRRDGFVSLEAPEEGHMLTKPIACRGGKLHINARTAVGGSVSVAIRRGDGELDGERLREWNYEKNVEFTGDSIDHTVQWTNQVDLGALKGRAIRLEFRLRRAELFSFWLQ